jgi:hypothetical protein
MASPLKNAKQSVALSSGGAERVPGSRIRREPPPPENAKKLEVRDHNVDDRRMAVIGIVVFALAMFVIIVAFAAMGGWTPRQYIARV